MGRKRDSMKAREEDAREQGRRDRRKGYTRNWTPNLPGDAKPYEKRAWERGWEEEDDRLLRADEP